MIALLTQSSSLTLRLHQNKDISLTDGTLDVTDDKSGLVVNELDTDLSNSSSGAIFFSLQIFIPYSEILSKRYMYANGAIASWLRGPRSARATFSSLKRTQW